MPRSALVFGLALTLLVVACSAPTGPPGFQEILASERVYTLTNLHPDEQRSRLYTVNYQLDALIPVCTPVRITKYGRRYMSFEVIESGKVYNYYFHKAAAEPFPDHLVRFFGPECPSLARFGARDREGIQTGRPAVGMTKPGVTIAMGHPPRHVNPDPENAKTWTYWRNRFGQMFVEFDASGRVSSVR